MTYRLIHDREVMSVGVKTIPVQDLKRHYDAMAATMRKAALRVLDSGWYVLGQEVRAFEEEFAAYIGTRECVSVANGTDALEIALRALQIRPGDHVCTVANAGMYSTAAILNAGAKPVFVDIRADTMTMSATDLVRAITPQTKAVIVTHLYGGMADMPAIMAFAQARGLRVIEDCAQAHGAKEGNARAGAWGDLGCFSFYPTKNLGALGDGGAITVNDQEIAHRLRALRQYGWTARYCATIPGGRNSRLDELQAAFLREQLPLLDGWNARRREIALSYNEALADTGLLLPQVNNDSYVAHLYVARLPGRNEFRQRLAKAGIASDVHYPVPDYAQPAMREQLGDGEPLCQTEHACGQVVTLPCFPEMLDSEVTQVVMAVLASVEQVCS